MNSLNPFAGRVRWLLIFWIFVMSAIAYLDRVNISIAGRTIANEFHLSQVQLGFVFSAFILGYAAGQAPAGWLADRFGPRLILLVGAVWWAVFTTAITLLSPGMGALLWAAIVIRFLLGAGEAVVYPASNTVVAAWIPSSERGKANGLIFSGVGLGSGITPPFISYLMSNYGWRASFWASAGLGLVAGAIWYFVARNSPREHPWVSPNEAARIEAGILDGKKAGGALGMSWRQIFSHRDILLITFSYFTYGYAAYIFFSWFFIYLNEVRNVNLKQSTLYTMLPFLAMTAGSLLGGFISDRVTSSFGKKAGRCGIAVVGISLAAIFIALGTQVESALLATVVLAGGAGALYLSQSSFWSVTADIGGRSAGSVSGFMNAGGQLGGALTASLTPAIARSYGWTASFLVAAALCACGALVWLWVKPEGTDSEPSLTRP
jgi:ACS family glucarate transporter-like MFS transporter